MDLTVRTMSREDLAVAVEWAAREGWNPGLDDATPFYLADPDGFFMAEADGQTVGAISAVRYGSDYGFVGLYIVKPEFRGHEVGWKLAEHALAHLAGRIIGIDGVLAKQEQYARFFGFQLAYRNIRYGGVIEAPVLETENLVPLADVPFAALAAFDREYFPADREIFLREWIAMPHSTGWALIREGVLSGYGVIRACREGFKIGPLFAREAGMAETLLRALCRQARNATVFLDVPEVNPVAMALAGRYGMKEVFATARMYRGGIPTLPLEGIFGVTTFELG